MTANIHIFVDTGNLFVFYEGDFLIGEVVELGDMVGNPPMFDIYKHEFHGYASDSHETFFYNFAVQGYDVSFLYKGQMHYLMYDKGKAAVCDDHYTKQYVVYPDPNVLIEQYEIDGHRLIDLIDQLEEVEAV